MDDSAPGPAPASSFSPPVSSVPYRKSAPEVSPKIIIGLAAVLALCVVCLIGSVGFYYVRNQAAAVTATPGTDTNLQTVVAPLGTGAPEMQTSSAPGLETMAPAINTAVPQIRTKAPEVQTKLPSLVPTSFQEPLQTLLPNLPGGLQNLFATATPNP